MKGSGCASVETHRMNLTLDGCEPALSGHPVAAKPRPAMESLTPHSITSSSPQGERRAAGNDRGRPFCIFIYRRYLTLPMTASALLTSSAPISTAQRA